MGILALFTAALVLCQAAPLPADTGGVHRTVGSGLAIDVDTRWADGFGYRPVKVKITPLKPVVADRTLSVEFLVRCHWQEVYDLRVEQDVEIPQDSGPVEVTLAVPQYIAWNAYAINVSEDGQLLEKLCTTWTSTVGQPNEWSESLPAILIVGDALPDTGVLASHLPVDQYNQPYNTSASVSPGSSGTPLPTAISRKPAELPQRWIDYSNLDVVCTSLERLAELRQKHPAALQAVLHWTSAGGNLWVYDVGKDWQRIGELEKLVGLPAKSGSSNPALRGWQWPRKSLYGKRVRGAMSESGAQYERDYPIAADDVAVEITEVAEPPPPTAPSGRGSPQPHFLLREYDLGMIVALAPKDPFPGKRREWGWVLSAVGSNRWLWYRRHGLSMIRRNDSYWNFLIPGVGLAPVTEFCILITLFVLAIGPLNYWLLRRARRIHLLVVTIPVSATVVTMLLFGYALVADGLGTRVRVRSVTRIDQRRGHAACWSRLSYYAGLSPSEGMEFPGDVAVLPLEQIPVSYNYPGRPLRRELIWEEKQRLASGWLSSRTPTQFVTVRSRRTKIGLELIAPAGRSAQWKVKNNLGTRIGQLLVCGYEGGHFWATDVDAGGTAVLKPVEASDARAKLWQTCQLNRPALPEGMDEDYYGGIFGLSSRRMYWGRYWGSNSLDEPSQATGRLEGTLSPLCARVSARGALLQPGSYAAIVERSPEVELGVASAREESACHVVLGRW